MEEPVSSLVSRLPRLVDYLALVEFDKERLGEPLNQRSNFTFPMGSPILWTFAWGILLYFFSAVGISLIAYSSEFCNQRSKTVSCFAADDNIGAGIVTQRFPRVDRDDNAFPPSLAAVSYCFFWQFGGHPLTYFEATVCKFSAKLRQPSARLLSDPNRSLVAVFSKFFDMLGRSGVIFIHESDCLLPSPPHFPKLSHLFLALFPPIWKCRNRCCRAPRKLHRSWPRVNHAIRTWANLPTSSVNLVTRRGYHLW